MAYMHERAGRAKARSLISRTGFAPVGGHFAKGGHPDMAEDAKMITKAVHEHESAMHPGKKETRISYAEGGTTMPRMDQRARGGAGGPKKSSKSHGPTINIAVAPHPPMAGPPMGGPPGMGAGPPAMPPRPPMPAPPPPRPPMPMPPGGAMGAPPMGMGGPPMPMAPPPGLPPGMPPRPPIATGGRLARGGRARESKIKEEAKSEGESYAEEKREQREGRADGGRARPGGWADGGKTGSGPSDSDSGKFRSDQEIPDSPEGHARGGRSRRADGGASDPLDSLDSTGRSKHADGGATHRHRLVGGTSDLSAQKLVQDPPRLDAENTKYLSSASPQLQNALAHSDKQMIPHQQDQVQQPPPVQRKSGGDVGPGRLPMRAGAGSGPGRLQKSRSAPGVSHGGIGRA